MSLRSLAIYAFAFGSMSSGAGGRTSIPGDYLYGDHREPYREAGIWGLFRVYPLDADLATLRHLPPS